MTEIELKNKLIRMVERLLDARDEIEGDDDDIALADIDREMVDELEGIASAQCFEETTIMTDDTGVLVRTTGGAKFHVSIVKAR